MRGFSSDPSPIKPRRERSLQRAILDEVGAVTHLAKSGRLIVKANRKVNSGTALFMEGGEKVGVVTEVIGPVHSPYITATPLTRRPLRLKGAKVFVMREVKEHEEMERGQ